MKNGSWGINRTIIQGLHMTCWRLSQRSTLSKGLSMHILTKSWIKSCRRHTNNTKIRRLMVMKKNNKARKSKNSRNSLKKMRRETVQTILSILMKKIWASYDLFMLYSSYKILSIEVKTLHLFFILFSLLLPINYACYLFDFHCILPICLYYFLSLSVRTLKFMIQKR